VDHDKVVSAGCDCTPVSAGFRQWQIWRVVAAIGQAAAIALLIQGLVRLRRASEIESLDRKEIRRHTAAAAVFVVCIAAFTALVVNEERPWAAGLGNMDARLGLVGLIGVLCAFPWVAMTWLGHQATRPYWSKVVNAERAAATPAKISTPAPAAGAPPDEDAKIDDLLSIWDHIVSVALAFAVLVVVALVPTGALRNLWLSQKVAEEDDKDAAEQLAAMFPSSDVLVYGAFFGLLIIVLVIPLLLSWRATARNIVDQAQPRHLKTAATPGDFTARGNLESMLNLDVSFLRNPLAVLSILTPLVTATLAAFLPELGK